MVWLPLAMAAFALLVAVGASALSLHSPTARAEADLPGVREGTAPWLVELMRSNQHAHSQAQQAVSGAYHDASRRADACSEELRAAVADLARAESRAQTCDRDLLARDEYLKAAAPEVARIKARSLPPHELEITRDHPRPPEITRDLIRDHPRSGGAQGGAGAARAR